MFLLFEAWGTWNEVEIYDRRQASKDQHRLKEKIEKEKIEKGKI